MSRGSGRPELPIVFGVPLITEAEIAEVVDTLRSQWIGTGPKTKLLEQRFAAQVEHVIAAVRALVRGHLSELMRLRVPDGRETPVALAPGRAGT